MFDDLDRSPIEGVVDRFTAVVDELIGLDLSTAGQEELLDLLRGMEGQRRRLAVGDQALIAALEARGTALALAARNTAALLRDVLRVSPSEAKARCTAAADLAPRRAFSGEVLPAVFPAVAAAQAEGAVSTEHAAVIRREISKLPTALRVEHGGEGEEFLVEHAHRYCPLVLARLARHTRDVLDPDGTLADEAHAERMRSGVLTVRRDGTGRLTVQLTPQGLAVASAVLDVLEAPRPADADGPDPRTAPQRMHDAVLDCLDRILRAEDDALPGGDAATILLTLTPDQLQDLADQAAAAAEDAAGEDVVAAQGADEQGAHEQLTTGQPAAEPHVFGPSHGGRRGTGQGGGVVRTGTGELLTGWAALSLCDQARLVPVALNEHGAVTAQGSVNRIASRPQRHALAVRDRGCCFPGCDAPPGWTQAHHVTEWCRGGLTELFNLCLLCRYHHREFGPRGWRVTMRDSVPWWTPPARIDPDRTPIRNHMHDTPVFTPRT